MKIGVDSDEFDLGLKRTRLTLSSIWVQFEYSQKAVKSNSL